MFSKKNNKHKIKPDRDLVEIFLIIIAVMFVLVLSQIHTAYGLKSYSLELSESCIYYDCFDICELSIFDNSTAAFSGPLNYNDGCSRSEPGIIPLSLLFTMYGLESIIEINSIDQDHKDKTTITIFPDFKILVNSIRANDGIIRHYNQTAIDRNCELIKVTNDFNIIASMLSYVLSNCTDRTAYDGIGNYNQLIEFKEKTIRYPTSSKAFLNNCLAGQDDRFDIIDCYDAFKNYQDLD